jgi:rhomboid protease GluP
VSAPTPLAIIHAGNERQAMDWSLVLTSQGIETVIEELPEHGWVLLVPPEDHTRGARAIALYCHENRRWGWRQTLNLPEFTFHWGVLFWCLGLTFFHWLGTGWIGRLELVGAMNNQVAVTGQWWRLLTAQCLHADLGHLAANTSTGFVLLGLAMARFGPGTAMLAVVMAGAFGNLASHLVHTQRFIGLGASGMVMGALGLLAMQSAVLLRRQPQAWRVVVGAVAGGVLLFILTGLNPASDVVAHTGGFLGGLAIGATLAWVPEPWLTRPWFSGACGTITMLLLAIAWALALSA